MPSIYNAHFSADSVSDVSGLSVNKRKRRNFFRLDEFRLTEKSLTLRNVFAQTAVVNLCFSIRQTSLPFQPCRPRALLLGVPVYVEFVYHFNKLFQIFAFVRIGDRVRAAQIIHS